ncbi:radical SAM protein [candidate division WOR-3 bacterium]|uniref:Radical SAM protein n=1 Tax=candidate division WOR-3 bacterium TaxID=2052148 RepID=A0A9D5QE85_UNCW3|nr:radical SAM protein [candidate division WOR-3 bacterium]MBD3364800.1 radical SAM protein [candidate division WOR-3 bacterium]
MKPGDYTRLVRRFLRDPVTGRLRIYKGVIALVKSFAYYYLLCRKVNCKDYALEYDKASGTYERWTDLMGKYSRTIVKLDCFESTTGQVDILDLACGKGYITANLLGLWDEKGKGDIRITAVDYSKGMLAAAKKAIRDSRVSFVHSEGLDFLKRVPDSTYYGIFFGWALPYFDHKKLVPQLARVLRPGGIVALISNREGTLEDIEDIFIDLIASNPEQVSRIAEMSFRLPQNEEGLEKWFTGYGFKPIEKGSGEEVVVFDDPSELVRWLRETSAVAGTGCIFKDEHRIESSIVREIARRRRIGNKYSINHSFVWGIFRKPFEEDSQNVNISEKRGRMFLSNLPVLLRMLTDLRNLRFTKGIHDILKPDPGYSFAGYLRMLSGSVRGERILRHKGRYVITSYVPPVPSRAFLSFLTASKDPSRPFGDLAWARRRAPLSTYLCITDRCTYKCRHCSAKLRRGGPELSTKQWINVIGKLQNMGTAYIGFTGGEPLMREDMEEIISSIDERSATVLFTNGKGLSPKRAKSLNKSGLFSLSVSLDSANPVTHNRLRGDDSAFDTALSAISNSRKAGLYTIVQAVIFKRELSRKGLFRLFKLVKKYGAHEIRIHQPVPSGLLLESLDSRDIFFSDDNRSLLFDIQFAANRRWFGFPKVSSFPYTEGAEKFGCNAGIIHSYVTASGEMTPCDFIPVTFGNVLDENPEDIWKRMNSKAGIPKPGCWAIDLAPFLQGHRFPIDSNDFKTLSASGDHDFPRFYRDLQE